MRLTRVAGAAAALVLVGILVATLTPSPGTRATPPFLCFACGEQGGVDFAANIVLFVPLGFALAMATGRRWASVGVCVAATLAIEFLQYRVVAGRDSSLSDLVANTLGGWLGVELGVRWRFLSRPTVRGATLLTIGWSALFAITCSLASEALSPAPVARTLWLQWAPERLRYEPFSGRLIEVQVGDIALSPGPVPPSLGLDRALSGARWQLSAVVALDETRSTRSVIARVADSSAVLISAEQRAWDLVCERRTRAAAARLRSPKVALPNALRTDGHASRAAVRLACGGSTETLMAEAGKRRTVLRLSPSLGWHLILPFDVAVTEDDRWISALWLMGLALPLGYWGLSAIRVATRLERRRAIALTTASAVIAVAVGLVVAPVLTRTAVATWWEWSSALVGVTAGALLAQCIVQAPAREAAGEVLIAEAPSARGAAGE